jgi:CO dehydrogenase/acetyl-CoA synthase epsilon subunit
MDLSLRYLAKQVIKNIRDMANITDISIIEAIKNAEDTTIPNASLDKTGIRVTKDILFGRHDRHH